MEGAARIGQDLLRNCEQLPVGGDLLVLALGGSHALELLHPFAGRAFAVGKARHVIGNDIAQLSDQADQNADGVPEQSRIGGPMDVGFHDRCIRTEFVAIFQTVIDCSFNHGVINLFHRGGSQPIERLVEGIMLGHGLAVETGELAQCISIINAFAQFTVIPVLVTHQNERAENLLRGQSTASGFWFLQTAV